MIAGGVIIFVSILFIIFPKIFLNMKSPDTVFVRMKEINDNPKIILCVRIWGCICLILGVVLIIKSFL